MATLATSTSTTCTTLGQLTLFEGTQIRVSDLLRAAKVKSSKKKKKKSAKSTRLTGTVHSFEDNHGKTINEIKNVEAYDVFSTMIVVIQTTYSVQDLHRLLKPEFKSLVFFKQISYTDDKKTRASRVETYIQAFNQSGNIVSGATDLEREYLSNEKKCYIKLPLLNHKFTDKDQQDLYMCMQEKFGCFRQGRSRDPKTSALEKLRNTKGTTTLNGMFEKLKKWGRELALIQKEEGSISSEKAQELLRKILRTYTRWREETMDLGKSTKNDAQKRNRWAKSKTIIERSCRFSTC